MSAYLQYKALTIAIVCTIAFVIMAVYQGVRINTLSNLVTDLQAKNIQLEKQYSEQAGAALLSEKLRREEHLKLSALLATSPRDLSISLHQAEAAYEKRIAAINCLDLESCIKILCEELNRAGFKTECK